MVKEIEANLCFSILGRGIFFLKIAKSTFFRYPVCRNFVEIALSCIVKEIAAFWAKIRKIQNGRHMWEEENFLKITKCTLLRYPVGQKF